MQNKLTRRGLVGLTAGAGLAACSPAETISGKNKAVVKVGAFAHGVSSGDPFTNSVVIWTRVTTDLDGDAMSDMGRTRTLPDGDTDQQYRSDAALQAATAAMPLIAVWDDHETTNDSWQTGAQNHQPETEGDWDTRKQAALRAYYEWMPIREPKAGRVRSDIYRNFRFGNLANLTCVETRLTARAEPIIVESYIDDISAEGGADKFRSDVLYAPDREMFGADQQDFIIDALRQSKQDGVPWRLLANQVIMGRLLTPDFSPYIDETALARIEVDWPEVRDFLTLSKYNMPVYPDSWDGYPVARENFYAALDAAGLNDMLVLTGDAHEFWLNELTSEAGRKVGLELVTSSVSSETLTAYLGDGTAEHNLLLTKENPDARYYNATRNGFIDLTLTAKSAPHISAKAILIGL